MFALIAFICAVTVNLSSFAWPCFVGISALIHVAVSFIIHIINYFPDMMIALVIVS